MGFIRDSFLEIKDVGRVSLFGSMGSIIMASGKTIRSMGAEYGHLPIHSQILIPILENGRTERWMVMGFILGVLFFLFRGKGKQILRRVY